MIGNNQNFLRMRKKAHNSVIKDIFFPKIDISLALVTQPEFS